MKKIFITLLALTIWTLSMAQYSKPYEITYRADKKSYLICNRGDGSVIEIDSTFSSKKVVTGLSDPRDLRYAKFGTNEGLVILDENKIKLFDGTYSSVIEINIGVATDAESIDFDQSNPGFFYISDVAGNSIIEGEVGPPPFYLPTFSVLVDTGLSRPSGVFIDSKNRMLVVSEDTGSVIWEVNKSTGAHKIVARTGLDSVKRIVEDKEGNFYLTNWGDSYQYRMDASLKNAQRLKGYNNPTGMYLNAEQDWLLSCCTNCNKMEIQKLHWFEPMSDLSSCSADSIKVNLSPQFNGIGTYYSNNRFVVELSGKNGDFSKAVDLGYVETDDNPSAIPVYLPMNNYPTGLEYRIRSTNPKHYSTSKAFTAWNTPAAFMYGSDSVDLCENSSLQLGTTGAVNASYFWNPGGLVTDSMISNPKFEASNSGSYLIQLRTLDTITRCADSNSLYLSVSEDIELSNLKRDIRSCLGTEVAIGLAASPYRFEWSPSFGLSNDRISEPIWDARMDTIYHINLTDPQTGCTGMDSVRVQVDPLPDLASIRDSFNTCAGDSLVLETGVDTSYDVVWRPAEDLSDSTSALPVFKSANAGNVNIDLNATNERACESRTSVSITVLRLPDLPDVKAERKIKSEVTLRMMNTSMDSVDIWGAIARMDSYIFLTTIHTSDSTVMVDSAMSYFTLRGTTTMGCVAYGDTVHAPYVPVGSVRDLYSRLEVNPQPSNGYLWFSLTGTSQVQDVVLYDVRGAKMSAALISSTGPEYRLDLSGLNDGVYLLEVSYGPGLKARKKIILAK